jgi:hypothetical protein
VRSTYTKTPLKQHLQKPKPFNKLVIFSTHAYLNYQNQ